MQSLESPLTRFVSNTGSFLARNELVASVGWLAMRINIREGVQGLRPEAEGAKRLSPGFQPHKRL